MIVVLDSTVFIGSGLENTPLSDLAICSKRGDVSIVVPELVRREVSTNLADKAIREKRSAVAQVGRWLRQDELTTALKTLDRLVQHRDELVFELEDRLDVWLRDAGVRLAPVAESDASAVFDDYFLGAGVFEGAAKERKHFPDAWVLQCARECSNGEDIVAVVTADKHLGQAVRREGFRLFRTVADLLLDGGIQHWVRVSGVRVETAILEELMVEVAGSVALAGPPVWIPEPVAGTVVEIAEEGSLVKLRQKPADGVGTVYVSFKFHYADAESVLEWDESAGRPEKSVRIGRITASGHLRLRVATDPEGHLFSTDASIAEVATHAPPGFEGC